MVETGDWKPDVPGRLGYVDGDPGEDDWKGIDGLIAM